MPTSARAGSEGAPEGDEEGGISFETQVTLTSFCSLPGLKRNVAYSRMNREEGRKQEDRSRV